MSAQSFLRVYTVWSHNHCLIAPEHIYLQSPCNFLPQTRLKGTNAAWLIKMGISWSLVGFCLVSALTWGKSWEPDVFHQRHVTGVHMNSETCSAGCSFLFPVCRQLLGAKKLCTSQPEVKRWHKTTSANSLLFSLTDLLMTGNKNSKQKLLTVSNNLGAWDFFQGILWKSRYSALSSRS